MAVASVPKLYQSVIEDVITNVREAFIDEGVDEQVLTELKQVWEKKLVESKAIEREPEPIISRTVAQSLPTQQVQQQAAQVASSATIAHQLTMPSGNLVPQALLQYTTTGGGSGNIGKAMYVYDRESNLPVLKMCKGDGQRQLALSLPQKLTLTVPAHIAQTGLQTLVSGAPGTTAVTLPPELAASLLQGSVFHTAATQSNPGQHGQQISGLQYQTLTAEQLQKAQQFTVAIPVTAAQSQTTGILQIDGADDTSDDEEEEDFQDNEDDRDDNDEEQNDDDAGEEDEEPLNSDDDVSDDDPSDLFDTENVVVCQYDKITRSKNRWKFHLKDGIMNLQGKDYVFQKALGDSEW